MIAREQVTQVFQDNRPSHVLCGPEIERSRVFLHHEPVRLRTFHGHVMGICSLCHPLATAHGSLKNSKVHFGGRIQDKRS